MSAEERAQRIRMQEDLELHLPHPRILSSHPASNGFNHHKWLPILNWLTIFHQNTDYPT